MTGQAYMAWSIIVPLTGAMLTYLSGRRAATVAAMVALATCAAAAGVVWHVAREGALLHPVGGWSAPLGIVLRADGISTLVLATSTTVGALLTGYLAVCYRGRADSLRDVLSLWCLTWAAIHAVFLSHDVFNLYVSLELTTLAAVGLIGTSAGRDALRAALRYLLVSLVGSLAYLTGVVLLYAARSVLDLELLAQGVRAEPASTVALSLMIVGLALKSALFPLHGWLPAAYASPPAPVAAVLASLVTKTPYYVLLRLFIALQHTGIFAAPARIVGLLGSGGILWGSLLASREKRLARLLAYSSVAQIGSFCLFFPLGTPLALQGALYLLVSHAVAKSSLFIALGSVRELAGDDTLDDMPGLARKLPVTFFSMALAGSSLIGMPPTGGFIGKWLLVRAAFEARTWWCAVVLLGGGLLTATYVFRLLRGAFLPLPEETTRRTPPAVAGWMALTLALAGVALGLFPWLPLGLIRGGTP